MHSSHIFPQNSLAQLVIATCVAFDIDNVVISPGSRNAPLTIGFTSHPAIKTYSIVDERVAAFVGLGMAQQKRKPVVLVCTSGSALLNYYPAIAEAFYSDIPLVVVSADRPEYLIDIGDGQTIRQTGVFEKHSHCDVNLQETNKKDHHALLKKALSTAIHKRGPVHINVPFDEPLYKTTTEIISVEIEPHLKMAPDYNSETPLELSFLEPFADQWNTATKKIVLVGCHFPSELLKKQLEHLLKDPSVLVFVENTSNFIHEKAVYAIDQLLFPFDEKDKEALQPEIVLSLGGLVVSKRVKQYLRKYKPNAHWHIDSNKGLDTFLCMSQHFSISPQLFFSQFFFLTKPNNSSYQTDWMAVKLDRERKHQNYLKDLSFSDLKVHQTVLQSLPNNLILQLGNSSVVRYAQFFKSNPTHEIFCNRGTSGIDGSTSTAIGAAMTTKKQTVFITGDVSFFYDSNALWNGYIPNNFRIILINNNGGGIFKFIPGPSESSALPYFETPHGLNASQLCEMHGFAYQSVSDEETLQSVLLDFFENGDKPKLLEVHTPSDLNDDVLKQYFKSL
ncbi:MAG: 2-succinyl-5-enolpyruvyl-6-hydroxy-3-cyclohexene-1-carboxylic-acid synthase [Flavicella sp.]